ncbi:MAG: class I SAM-dependent methyltransferase [Solirubrobacterales bacterium]
MGGIGLAKLCDAPDFRDPELLGWLREILPERDPATHVERKVWEFAMLARFLEKAGALGEHTRALAVGAGDERIVFWLANRLGSVVATDIYGSGSFSDREADAAMLTDPASRAPFAYRQERLEVRWMDARELDFPDDSFDVVFSLSSIEHMGGPAEVARVASEMGRVVRPGGHVGIVTECLVRHHPRDRAPAEVAMRAASLGRRRPGATLRRRSVLREAFTPRELRRRIIGPSGLELVEPLNLGLSAESWENVARIGPDGSVQPRTGTFYPHLLVEVGRSVFTSVFLPLRAPGGEGQRKSPTSEISTA